MQIQKAHLKTWNPKAQTRAVRLPERLQQRSQTGYCYTAYTEEGVFHFIPLALILVSLVESCR